MGRPAFDRKTRLTWAKDGEGIESMSEESLFELSHLAQFRFNDQNMGGFREFAYLGCSRRVIGRIVENVRSQFGVPAETAERLAFVGEKSDRCFRELRVIGRSRLLKFGGRVQSLGDDLTGTHGLAFIHFAGMYAQTQGHRLCQMILFFVE